MKEAQDRLAEEYDECSNGDEKASVVERLAASVGEQMEHHYAKVELLYREQDKHSEVKAALLRQQSELECKLRAQEVVSAELKSKLESRRDYLAGISLEKSLNEKSALRELFVAEAEMKLFEQSVDTCALLDQTDLNQLNRHIAQADLTIAYKQQQLEQTH